jgi:hypothetical protein
MFASQVGGGSTDDRKPGQRAGPLLSNVRRMPPQKSLWRDESMGNVLLRATGSNEAYTTR